MCQHFFLYWHLWLRGCEKMCTRACVIVYALRTEDALNIRCTLKPAVASIGEDPLRGTLIGKVWKTEIQTARIVYTHTHICLHWFKLACVWIPSSPHPPPLSFGLPYLSFIKSIQLSLAPSATFWSATNFFSALFALFLVSPANMICLLRSISACILSLAFCFTCCYLPSFAP